MFHDHLRKTLHLDVSLVSLDRQRKLFAVLGVVAVAALLPALGLDNLLGLPRIVLGQRVLLILASLLRQIDQAVERLEIGK